jgi:hypothetical protein
MPNTNIEIVQEAIRDGHGGPLWREVPEADRRAWVSLAAAAALDRLALSPGDHHLVRHVLAENAAGAAGDVSSAVYHQAAIGQSPGQG